MLIEAPERPVAAVVTAGGEERIRERIRVTAFCLLLLVLPFVSAPGDLISDTKLDLAINPARFLARALTLWDPTQFGQLQNQAVGYLFPMGPYFLLGKLAGLPPWVIQRLWIGTVLIAAFLGTFWLARRLGIGTPWTRILGGLCYAASPMALSLAGVESALFLPAAMLPWVLLPLAGPAFRGRGGQVGVPGTGRRGSTALARLRAVARSGLAVAACGGTNAAATLPILVVALLFILFRSGPAPRWRVLAWWLPAVALATVWWAVPLLLLGKYGVSFLPYTESASVTTSVTSLSNILRGTEDWTSYLVMYGQPCNQLAYKIATDTVPIVLSGLIAGLGLAGLLRRGLPERRFLLLTMLAGVLIIGTGYVSGLGNPLASQLGHLINGPGGAAAQPVEVRPDDPAAGRARPGPPGRRPSGPGPGARARGGAGQPAGRGRPGGRGAGRGRAGGARVHQRAGRGRRLPADPAVLGERGQLAGPARGPAGGAGGAGRRVRPVPVGQPDGRRAGAAEHGQLGRTRT